MAAITFGGTTLTLFGQTVSWFGADALSRPRLRLEADGLETLDLSRTDVAAAFLDLGDALTREVSMNMPGANGTIDTTSLTGARVVTLEVLVNSIVSNETRWELTQRLRAFTHPRIRPRLVFQPSADDPELVLTLRRSQFSDVWGPNDRGHSKITVQWVCPSGVVESAEEHSAIVSASGVGSAGITFPVTFPITFPDATPEGSTLITNAGSMDTYPIIRLYGPFSGVTSIVNDLTGLGLAVDGVVAAGDFLELDTRPGKRTIFYNGDPTNSRYSQLVFPGSQWWPLVSGPQRIRFVPDVFSFPAQAVVLWRDAWL